MKLGRSLAAAALAAVALFGCRDSATGPIVVSAIGSAPKLASPGSEPLEAPSAYLLEAAAQGLLRFDQSGQVEPALAQSWIVSDDGLRYTFRLARTKWANGSPVTAEQVEARLRSMFARSSRNPLKPLLGVVTDVQAMTESVLEIALKAPRPNFLQLLAQPEMAIVRSGQGTGPFLVEKQSDGAALLSLPKEEDEDTVSRPEQRIVLRGERAALAIARFRHGSADLVAGGTAGDLPIVRVADLPGGALRFDPVSGFLGLQFLNANGALASADVRQALSMALDRPGIVTALGVPDLAPRESLVPPGVAELPNPALPAWSADPLPVRRERARRIVAGLKEKPAALRVAIPATPGYRLLLAYLKRDWQSIGIEAQAVAPGAAADLALVDAVAAANSATWYLRHFTCDTSAICSPEADGTLENARTAQATAERQALLATADRALVDAAPFIPITAPVRWSLVSPRLTGFQPNPFARHFVGGLVAPRR
jgi:peptide/nickel transport system substrate-binding protein